VCPIRSVFATPGEWVGARGDGAGRGAAHPASVCRGTQLHFLRVTPGPVGGFWHSRPSWASYWGTRGCRPRCRTRRCSSTLSRPRDADGRGQTPHREEHRARGSSAVSEADPCVRGPEPRRPFRRPASGTAASRFSATQPPSLAASKPAPGFYWRASGRWPSAAGWRCCANATSPPISTACCSRCANTDHVYSPAQPSSLLGRLRYRCPAATTRRASLADAGLVPGCVNGGRCEDGDHRRRP